MADLEQHRPIGLAKPTRVLVTLASAGVAAWAIWAGRGFLGPLILAAVLVIVAHPVRRPLDRRGLPRWLGTVVVVATAYAIIAVLGVVIVLALGQFARVLTDYASELQKSSGGVAEFLGTLGFDPASADTVGGWLQPDAILHGVFNAGKQLVGLGAALFFVLGYVWFMAIDARRLAEMPDELAAKQPMRVRSFRGFVDGTARYYVVNTIFGAIVAIIDGLAIWAIGIPLPFVWAVLAFVTNYIPNVGFVIGLLPPFVLALVIGGWGMGLLVLALYAVVNVVVQELIQPHFVARTVRLSVTLTFFSVVLWSVLLGPIGAILAVPLSLLVRFLLIGDDKGAALARWLTWDTEDPP
ncbi:AI-2 transport protein TqsA [Leifsonia sp. EB41]|uniref:AI-2E family transporter n=1 Tax=Leifsonia sp. EB41 TaxID=3156260 RepID=UPI0035192E04